MRLLITGGAGFIGSALIRKIITETDCSVFNIDKLTYAAVPGALNSVEAHPRYSFVPKDICNLPALQSLFAEYRPDAVMHLAAETHVDRSIEGGGDFIQTNIIGTYTMLQASMEYWRELAPPARDKFRFHQISTDEVFGAAPAGVSFDETAPYNPSSPYAASKASGDHLVMAWHRTYGLPVLLSTCSNNYGPFQFPEKLIPLILVRALKGQSLPVYGDGRQERDWIHVDDHVTGLLAVLKKGRIGQSYAFGSGKTCSNLEVVTAICQLLDEARPAPAQRAYEDQIAFVDDRPGHDVRYALDAGKARRELDWRPEMNFADGLRDTVNWYLQNQAWWEDILGSTYDGERLGGATVATSPGGPNIDGSDNE